MDYYQMTAPCGLDCFNCTFFLAPEDHEAMKQVEQWSEELNIPVKTMLCHGCRSHNGQIPLQKHLSVKHIAALHMNARWIKV